MTRYLIVGNSVGCIGAIEALRQVDASGPIQVVSDEPYPSYSRPQIAGYLAGELGVEQALYRPRSFYPDYGVDLMLNRTVTQIDPQAKTASLSDGRVLEWDKCLLATGGVPIVPPVKGLDEGGYFTFTKMSDAQALKDRLSVIRRAVVVGGGLIGLSVTEALVKVGVDATVVELASQILGRALDSTISAKAQGVMESRGVRILTHCSVAEVKPAEGRPEAGLALLSNGVELKYDALIMAIGVRPRVELAVEAGLNVNRGILVDDHMQSSVKDVFACGDVAEAHDFFANEARLTPIWPNAYLGGRVAGLNMAGKDTVYEGGTAMNALHSFGYPILSAGIVSASEDEGYKVLMEQTSDGRGHRKIILLDGRIVGFIFAGDIDRAGVVYGLMKERVDVSEFAGKLLGEEGGLISLPKSFRFDMLRAKGVARRMMEWS